MSVLLRPDQRGRAPSEQGALDPGLDTPALLRLLADAERSAADRYAAITELKSRAFADSGVLAHQADFTRALRAAGRAVDGESARPRSRRCPRPRIDRPRNA